MEGAYLTCADSPVRNPSAPMVILNPAGTTHRDSFVVPEGRFLAISLSADVAQIAQQESGFPSAATAFVSGDALRAAELLAESCTTSEANDALFLEDRCWELLATVCGTKQVSARSRKFSPPWLRRARELLHDSAQSELSITAIAQQLHRHPISFARSFRRHFRCSPAEYRRRCRLQRAIKLLRHTDEPLSSVALRAGFFDQSHLTNAFRHHFGATPGLLKKRFETTACGPDEVSFLQDSPAHGLRR